MKKNIGSTVWKYSKIIVLLFIVIILSVFCPGTFLTMSNVSSILMAIAIFGVMACGMMFPSIISGPDLSVSGTAAVGSMVLVKTIISSENPVDGFYTGVLLAMLIGISIGLIIGSFTYFLNAPSFLISLSAQYILFAIAQLGTGNKVIICDKPDIYRAVGNGRFLGFPIQVYIFLIIALITYLVLHHTVYGRKVFLVGGNSKASKLTGTSNGAMIISTFAISGLTASVGGMMLSAMNQQATSATGSGYDVQVMLSVIIGGASFGEGIGSIPGALYGALFVGLLNNGMRLLGVSSIYQELIVGALIIAAVAFETYFINKASGLHFSKKAIRTQKQCQ